MDPTLGASVGEPGPGFQEDGGIIAPAFVPGLDAGGELDLSDDLAWDEFLPDEDESEDELEYEVEFSALAAEDAALAAEDLEMRWDAFAADDESEDDEESARVEAVLDRMEQRAKTYGDPEDAVDDDVADDTVVPDDKMALDDEVFTVDGDLAYATAGAPATRAYDAYDEEDEDADGVAKAVEVAVAAGPDVLAAHVASELEEPAVEDWAGEEEQGEEEEIDLLAIRAAWDDFRARWEDVESGDDHDAAASAASAAPREDGAPWKEWDDDEEYELVEVGAAEGSAKELTEGPLGWADDDEEVDVVLPVHHAFARTAEDEGAEDDPITLLEPGPVADSHEPSSWLSDDPVDDAVGVAVAAPFVQADESRSEEITAEADDADDRDDESEGRPPHTSARAARRGSETRRRVLLAALFVAVVVCAVVIVHSGRVRTETQEPAATASPVVASAAQVSHLESAISDIQSASSGAQAGLSTLSQFPTPPRVASIINPYVDSLELYKTLAVTIAVPTVARADFASANGQDVQDITFLQSINGLPPLQLGAFIKEFFARSSQLQAILDRLQQDLQPTAG